jgi:hypothetical protein
MQAPGVQVRRRLEGLTLQRQLQTKQDERDEMRLRSSGLRVAKAPSSNLASSKGARAVHDTESNLLWRTTEAGTRVLLRPASGRPTHDQSEANDLENS